MQDGEYDPRRGSPCGQLQLIGCTQLPADMGIPSDMGLANAAALLGGTAFVLTDVGPVGT